MLDKNNNTVITGQAPLLALSYVCAWRSFMARALNHQQVGSPNSSGAYGTVRKNCLLLRGGGDVLVRESSRISIHRPLTMQALAVIEM